LQVKLAFSDQPSAFSQKQNLFRVQHRYSPTNARFLFTLFLLFIACYVYSRAMLTNHFTLSKRLLGLLLLIVGIVGFVAVLSVDILDVGREGGIGPAQRIALGGAALIALIGLTLIPIRDQLA